MLIEPVFCCSRNASPANPMARSHHPTNKYIKRTKKLSTNPRFICLPNLYTPCWKDFGFVNCRHPSIFLDGLYIFKRKQPWKFHPKKPTCSAFFLYINPLKKGRLRVVFPLRFLTAFFQQNKTTQHGPSLEPFPWAPKQRPKAPTMGATTKWHHNTRAMVGE